MEQELGTILIKGPIWGRLNKAYTSLAFMPEHGDRSRTSTLDRYGAFEVRLMEISQGDPASDCLLWLELYCHVTGASLDSCRCDNLEDAETAADHLVASAKQLQNKFQ